MIKLAQSLGFDPSEGEEWFDAGWRYPWEESKRVKSAASNSAFDAIRYVDDFPEGALTIITTRDFKPEEEERLNPRQLMGININDCTQDFTGQFSRQSKRIAMKTSEYRNPVTPSIRKKLASVIEFDDRILCYDTAADEDFYRLWDIIHTDLTLNKESLREIEGMLDDDGVLVIESGETPAGMQDHFRKTTRYQGLLLVQGPLNPEQARIETEKLRRDLE